MTLGWTEIIVAFFTLLGCCAWFVEGRKHRPTANGLKADNRLKDMELARLYVQQFEETIGKPLRKQVGDLQNEIAQLRYAIQRIDYCAHRDDCPVLDGMRKQPKGDGGKQSDGGAKG